MRFEASDRREPSVTAIAARPETAANHRAVEALVALPTRTAGRDPPGSAGRATGLSVVWHAAALCCLLLVHPVSPPERTGPSYEVIFEPAAPEDRAVAPEAVQAPAVEESSAPPEQPAPAVAELPLPEVQPLVTPAPPAPEESPAPVRQAERPPTAPVRPSAARPHTPNRPRGVGMAAPPAAIAKLGPAPAATAVPELQLPHLDAAWLGKVSGWLLAHRSYPETARRRGEQGTVVVHAEVGSDGHVLLVSMVNGSGSRLLDEAALSLMRYASLPPFPADMTSPTQAITIPIRYQLE